MEKKNEVEQKSSTTELNDVMIENSVTVNSTLKKLANIHEQQNELTEEYDKLQQEREQIEVQVEIFSSKFFNSERENHLQQQAKEQEEAVQECETLKEEHAVMQQEHNALKQKYEDLQQEHNASQQKYENLHEEHNPLKQKYEDLQREHESLQQKYETSLQQQKSMVSSQQYKEVIDKMLATLNTIDQIAGAYRNTGENQLVAEQLEKVANIALAQLKDLQLEEIPVYGKEIDGEYMESFGVALHVADETLQPHQVAIVMRRAFKHSETGEIVQNALVYTVPEGE